MQSEPRAADAVMRVRQIVAESLGVDVSSIGLDANAESIETWDSIKHLAMVLAIEAEFGVRFEPEDLAESASVRALARIASRGSGCPSQPRAPAGS